MAIFITIVSLIVMLYFVQLGARRGVFPVLLTLLVTLLAFLIAMNYRVGMANLLQRWLDDWRPENCLAAGYFIIFLVLFCLFGYFAVRFTPEIAPLYKKLDRALGTIAGILAGLTLSGSLCNAWFTSSLAERWPIPKDSKFYFKPHEYLLATYGHVTGHSDPTGGPDHYARFPGGAWFNAKGIITKMAEKGSLMPRSGDGFWISSVPTGLRVFISTARAQPRSSFKNSLKGWVESEWEGAIAKSGRAITGFAGKTPVYVRSEDSEAWVAVEVVLPRRVAEPAAGWNPLVDDGQSDTCLGANQRFLKIYRLRKKRKAKNEKVVAKLIAMMYSRKLSPPTVEALYPVSPQFTINPDERNHALSELTGDGIPQDLADHLIDMARRGGKVIYEARDGSNRALEITSAQGQYRISTVSRSRR